jgi:transposase-like protein
VEDLKVPHVREGDFHPRILPYRKRASLELSEIILALYAVGVSTRKISHFLEGIYGAFYSPQSIPRLIQVTEEEVKAWRERPLSEEYYAVFFIVPHLLFKGNMVVSYLNFRKSSEPAS